MGNRRGLSLLAIILISLGIILLIGLSYLLYPSIINLIERGSNSANGNLQSSANNAPNSEANNGNNIINPVVVNNCVPINNPCGSQQCGTAQNGTCGNVICGSCNNTSSCINGVCILSGDIYILSDNNLYVGGQYIINASSLEFKIINAFKEMGYNGLTYLLNPEDSASTSALHRFQKDNNLPVSDILDKTTMALIDFKLVNIEDQDRIFASQYAPFSKFINAPLNEPPREHLAALYYKFAQALPNNMPMSKNWIATLDQFRISLITLGGNLGKMLDSTGTQVLNLSEMVDVMNNESDFRFCGDAYYSGFNTLLGGNCINPPLTINVNGPISDYGYFYTFIHEFGHGIGTIQNITINGATDEMDYLFGRISFGGNFSCGFISCPENSIYWLRTDNAGEFVTHYARVGYTENGYAQGTLAPWEDFAESFVFYMLQGKVFREKAKTNTYLQQKYDLLKTYVFMGREYDTGDINYYTSLVSSNPNATAEELLGSMGYYREEANRVWDGTYPVL